MSYYYLEQLTIFTKGFFEYLYCIEDELNKKIHGREVETVARVVFLLEEHGNKDDRNRNSTFLGNHYSHERGDIILVEDDQRKIPYQLNLKQIREVRLQKKNVQGWDSHLCCEKKDKVYVHLNKILSVLQRLESGIESKENKIVDMNYLFGIAERTKMKAFEQLQKLAPTRLLEDPNLLQQKQLFFNSCRRYVENAKNYTASQHFSIRQEALIKKIQECYQKTATGVIFVCAGRNHVDVENSSKIVKNSAQKLLSSLDGVFYCIV